MQTHFVRFGRSFKIPSTVQIKHELRLMLRDGNAACAKPNSGAAEGVAEVGKPIS